MILGEAADAIHAISFGLGPDYKCPDWPYKDTVKILEAEDGTVCDIVNFGAREERTADFTLVQMSRTEFYLLTQFCEARAGGKIRVQFENDAERVFGQQAPYLGPVVYAYLTRAEPFGESGYEGGHRLYSFGLTIDWAGLDSTAVPNVLDSGDLEVLITLDCVQVYAGCQVANLTALNAITTAPNGAKGLTVDDLKVYIMDRSSGSPVWRYLYKLPPNNPSIGLLNGVFWWSAFADISSTAPGIGGRARKAGIIREGSIKLPRRSAGHVRKQPGVERPEGFSFSTNLGERTWLYPVENNISFFEAKAEIAFYDRAAGIVQLWRTGINNRNSFDYSDYGFEIEPRAYAANAGFPVRSYSASNYPNHAESMEGKPILQTYGRFDFGEIQPASWLLKDIRFPAGRRFLSFVDYNHGAKTITLSIGNDQVAAVLGFPVADYGAQAAAAGPRLLYVKIEDQEDQPEKGVLKKVTAISASGADTLFTLSAAWDLAPNSTAQFLVVLCIVDLVISDRKCVGMRAGGYLRATGGIEVYSVPETQEGGSAEPVSVPSKIFKAAGSNENRLSIDSDFINLNSGSMKVQSEHELPMLPLFFIHATFDKVSTGAVPYRYFDFGFTSEGVASREASVVPVARPKTWDTFQHSINRNRQSVTTVVPGDGRIFAAFGSDRVTLIWTPWPGASGYIITRYLVTVTLITYDPKLRKPSETVVSHKIDTTFGTSGEVSVAGTLTHTYLDTAPNLSPTLDYEYRLEPVVAGQHLLAIASNRGRVGPATTATPNLYALGVDAGIILAWAKGLSQARVSIEIDSGGGFGAVPGTPIVSSIATYFHITGLANNSRYKVRIKMGTVAGGSAGDLWYWPPSISANYSIWQLKVPSNDGSAHRYDIRLDAARSAAQHPLLDPANYGLWSQYSQTLSVQYVVRNIAPEAGLGLPAASAVLAWAIRVDHAEIAKQLGGSNAMAGAKEVGILADFVCSSYVGDNTPQKQTVQLWGYRRDGTSFVLAQYEMMETKAPTESGSYGAYARYLNLPQALGGGTFDQYYKTSATSSNADGLYTGRDLWRLPDFLFDDDAYEWSQLEYLIFCVTNAEPVAYGQVTPKAKGFRLGFGRPDAGTAWQVTRDHKSMAFLEVLREFSGGLERPQIVRIDGGVVDEAGSITGTVGRIIEKAPHLVDDVLKEMLGYKPLRLGTEMASRDNWIWRWQTKAKRSAAEVLELLAKNIHGFFSVTADDRLCLRSLDINDAAPVFEFNDSNVLAGKFGKPQMSEHADIYQYFRLRYHRDAVQGKCTEEMVIGWDLAGNKPVHHGYADTRMAADGQAMVGNNLDGLDQFCRLSTLLYAGSGHLNEFGVDGDEEYELFYRPTYIDPTSGAKLDRDLPNLRELWGSLVFEPKRAMRDLVRKVIESKFANSWYFSIGVSVRHLVYKPEIVGVANEAGAPARFIQIGDRVWVKSYFHTKNQKLKAMVLDIDPSTFYDGYVTFWVWCPTPPGQFGFLFDPHWNAGSPGNRRNEDFLFAGDLYGLLDEAGGYADAGAPGSRDNNLFGFPDGTKADAQGFGTGKA